MVTDTYISMIISFISCYVPANSSLGYDVDYMILAYSGAVAI